jgi:hypothetical protein
MIEGSGSGRPKKMWLVDPYPDSDSDPDPEHRVKVTFIF